MYLSGLPSPPFLLNNSHVITVASAISPLGFNVHFPDKGIESFYVFMNPFYIHLWNQFKGVGFFCKFFLLGYLFFLLIWKSSIPYICWGCKSFVGYLYLIYLRIQEEMGSCLTHLEGSNKNILGFEDHNCNDIVSPQINTYILRKPNRNLSRGVFFLM